MGNYFYAPTAETLTCRPPNAFVKTCSMSQFNSEYMQLLDTTRNYKYSSFEGFQKKPQKSEPVALKHDKSTEMDQLSESWLSLIVDDVFMADDAETSDDESSQSTLTCSIPKSPSVASSSDRSPLSTGQIEWQDTDQYRFWYQEKNCPMIIDDMQLVDAYTQTMGIKCSMEPRESIGISPQSIDGSFVLSRPQLKKSKSMEFIEPKPKASVHRFQKALEKVAFNCASRKRRFSCVSFDLNSAEPHMLLSPSQNACIDLKRSSSIDSLMLDTESIGQELVGEDLWFSRQRSASVSL